LLSKHRDLELTVGVRRSRLATFALMVDFKGKKTRSTKMALNAQRKQKKKEVCESILWELRDHEDVLAMPAFAEELHSHFDRLPTR